MDGVAGAGLAEIQCNVCLIGDVADSDRPYAGQTPGESEAVRMTQQPEPV
jgi:hypothetical protein